MIRKTKLLGVAAVILIGAGCSADDEQADEQTGEPTATSAAGGTTVPVAQGDADEVDDVTITSCPEAPDEFGLVTIGLSVTNDSSEVSTYSISVGYFDAEHTRVADAAAFANNLPNGQTTTVDAVGSTSGTPSGPFTCELVSVERFAS